MADPNEELEDDILDDPELGDDQDDDQQDQEGDDDQEDDEGLVYSLDGDDEDGKSAEDEAAWVKELRKRDRENSRKLAEYEAREQQRQIQEVGDKPKLENFYDQDDPEGSYEVALDAWKDRKATADQIKEQATESSRKFQEEVQADIEEARAQAIRMPVKDFQERMTEIDGAFSNDQKTSILAAVKNKATFLYALASSPKARAELSKITNPLKLAAAAAVMENSMKTTPRKRAPEPEGITRGSAPMSSQSTDKKMQALEKEAERTGDRTKLIDYKRTQNAKASK